MSNKSRPDCLAGRPVHFIGCGGVGMAPLAMILKERGVRVSGSDLEANHKVELLRQHGISVTIGHSGSSLPEAGNALVVYSSAVGPGNPELRAAQRRNLECLRRGELLARLAGGYRRTVSVSGSHGKTTITSMLVHILKRQHLDIGYLIGGEVRGMDSFAAGDGDIFVTEVDESDGTHVAMDSHLAVIPNVDDDHCWSVGGVEQLIRNFKTYAWRSPKIIFLDSRTTREIFRDHPDKIVLEREDILNEKYFEFFDAKLFHSWGDYQLLNAGMAIEAAVELGVSFENSMQALIDYPGVERRMTEHYHNSKICLIEDYAHHPTEVRSSLAALRKRFPDRALTVIFQPHRYARLQRYLNDFVSILREPDAVIVVPVFAAWSEKSEVNARDLAYCIGGKARYAELPWDKLADLALKSCRVPVVLAVIGAGDVNKVIPELLNRLPH
ncbi:MAG: Mur ligase domain-containing protein [Victivallales bacterium]|nr:Mur ligase domain-containing protein [Victivallales bacterium]